jgi:hypothetical protein
MRVIAAQDATDILLGTTETIVHAEKGIVEIDLASTCIASNVLVVN